MDTMRTCKDCRKPIPADAPEGFCPECLMKAGLGSQPEPGATLMLPDEAAHQRVLPKAGQQFGGYRIVGELGHGGMGAVYDAEHLESGRRVALKVLSHKLDSPEARARFLREGRLAASINHPNSVYVYGTEEIEGTPAIAMELIAGGTLQERVQRQGPLAAGQAVDVILQVLAGLEAAQAVGILHRDIKPANCFEDADGTVKIGDFGLSISTAARGDTNLTLQGTFLGTPTFSSPEQLRGEELNVRSDIYSVGVTLFYLLTGHTPFAGKTMVQLLANVLEQPAPSPRQHRPDLPSGLAKVVLRCLEKQAGERFKNYDELRQALAPFSSAAPTPATLGLRFLAGVLDLLLFGMVGTIVGMIVMGDVMPFMDETVLRSPKFPALIMIYFVAMILYYTLLEGLRGATLGKMICRLRVTGPDRNSPGLAKAFVRGLIYVVVPVLPQWFYFGFAQMSFMTKLASSNPAVLLGVSFSFYGMMALLFCTMRRRNGFAALHDLSTQTRVIHRAACQARPLLPASEDAPPVAETMPMVGPYHILESLEKTATSEWLVGFDTRLLRKVWIRLVPPAWPPIAPQQRNLGRAGRLRWISGRRSPQENWDAFESVPGKALVNLLHQPQPWSLVRFWLLDLAGELSAAERDGTVPAVLALDRVWITADGRAKLLDFVAPGLPPGRGLNEEGDRSSLPPAGDRSLETQRFLSEVALVALQGKVGLPLSMSRSGPPPPPPPPP
ncbi:MAG: protein kinase, partial [Verrucomicrobia bacterium]|nr:protein kinase [Verrucomicrobiota bacterium]